MADRAPVFVFGALRSGTTMFRLMLDGHPQLSNPGEVDFLFDHLKPDGTHPTGWRYDGTTLRDDRIFRAQNLTLDPRLDGVDLLGAMIAQLQRRAPDTVLTLNVHRNARLIVETIPDARFIHMIRDPRDVARSCIGMGWCGNSYHGASSWIDSERGWDLAQKILGPDRVFTLRFEDLLADVEPQLARVCDFLGVPMQPAMLEYHRSSSYDPPDPRIVQQWRQRANRREIALIEGRCSDLMESRGYALEVGAHYPRLLERLRLAAENRIKRWQYNIRRYGLGLFIAYHLTRLPSLGLLHRRMVRRIEDKIVAGLK